MYSASQFAELNKAGVARTTKLAAIALENAEKLLKLNVAAAKVTFAQGVERASAVAAVKDPQGFFTLPTKYTEVGFRNAVGYSRNLHEISAAAQTEYSLVAKEAFDGYAKAFAAWADNTSASAPVGSELAFNAFKSSLAATTAAFDQFEKASKQAMSLAEAGIRAAAENVARATTAPKAPKAA